MPLYFRVCVCLFMSSRNKTPDKKGNRSFMLYAIEIIVFCWRKLDAKSQMLLCKLCPRTQEEEIRGSRFTRYVYIANANSGEIEIQPHSSNLVIRYIQCQSVIMRVEDV
jgi:hypothetical protein